MKTQTFAQAQADFELRRIEQKIDDMFGGPEQENDNEIDGEARAGRYDDDPYYDNSCPEMFDGR